jgi:hypothetical protein
MSLPLRLLLAGLGRVNDRVDVAMTIAQALTQTSLLTVVL